ncbi:tail length tape measure protein [Enterococcus phage vB_Efs19_KEN07]
MIKREALKFYSQEEFNDYLSQLSDETKILHYNVLEDVHYIITERKMSDEEAKEFKMNQLRKDIAKCEAHWEKVIKDCENAAHRYNQALNHNMSNLYMQRREDAVEAYNEEQRKLANKLDKLVKLDYTEFIR